MQTSMPPREAELADFLLMVWAERRLATTIAVAITAVVTAVAWALPRQYEATVLVTAESGSESIDTYISVIDSQAFITHLIDSEGLSAPPHSVSYNEFREDHLDVEALPGGRLLSISVKLDDPVLAAKLADRIAASVTTTVADLVSARAKQTRDLLREQTSRAQTERDRLEDEQLQFRRANQPEALNKDIDALLGLRGRRQELFIAMERERVRLASAERELAARPSVQSYKRTVLNDPTLSETARRAAGTAPLPLNLQFSDESPNPVVQSLDEVVATARANLAGLEKEWQEIDGRLRVGSDRLPLLQKSYDVAKEAGRLAADLALAREVYADLQRRLAQAEVDAVVKIVDVRQVAPAVVPLQRQDRPLLIVVLAALGAGLALGAVAAFLRQYLAQYRAATPAL
jgi:uncharacterized protein involved in exopolysaccharide biosynthesis